MVQFLYQLVSRGSGSLLQAVFLVLLARAVSLESYGKLATMVGIASFISLVADLGFTNYLTRSLSARPSMRSQRMATRASRLFQVAACMVVVLVFVVWNSAIGGGYELDADVQVLISSLIIWCFAERYIEFRFAPLIAARDGVGIFHNTITRRLVMLVPFLVTMIAGGAVAHLRVWVAAAASVAASAVGIAMVEISAKRAMHVLVRTGTEDPGTSASLPETVLGVLRAAVPFAMTSIPPQVKLLDTMIISWFASATAAGVYAAASKVGQPFFLFSSSLANVLYPYLSERTASRARRIAALAFVAVVVGMAVVFGCLPIADDVMVIVFGASYASGGTVLVLVLAGTVATMSLSPLSVCLQCLDRSRLTGVVSSGYAGCLVLALAGGAAVGGGEGAALGALVAAALCCLIFVVTILHVASQQVDERMVEAS